MPTPTTPAVTPPPGAGYEATPGVLQTDLQTELVLVDGHSGQAYRLNATARVAWLALPTTAAALGSRLQAVYGLGDAVALRDAEAALADLLKLGLARITPPA